jgi:hypothetical protein
MSDKASYYFAFSNLRPNPAPVLTLDTHFLPLAGSLIEGQETASWTEVLVYLFDQEHLLMLQKLTIRSLPMRKCCCCL